MADAVGKKFVPSGANEIRDQFLRDIRLSAIDTGVAEPPTSPGSDWYLLATAHANMQLLSLSNVAIADEDTSELTATGASLDEKRKALGLPEIPAAGSSGKIIPTITGATTIANGSTLTLPNGLRAEVVGTYVNPADGDEINVRAIDVGANSNVPAGEIVRFNAPPTNVASDAKVSPGEPLTGGTDAETDDEKRARILNVRRNKPAGGNWAHLREIALESSGSVMDCYVYPILGGPASQRVVPVKDFDASNNDYSRAPSSVLLSTVRAAIQANAPTHAETVVQAPVNESADYTLRVTIPESALAGGNGQGWTDPNNGIMWPILESGDANNVAITAASATLPQITVDAVTAAPPIGGQTTIAWWSAVDRKFFTALVLSATGATTAWVLNLDRQLADSTGAAPAVGDYVCPAAQNLEQYGKAWVDLFRSLGPGENTTDVSILQGGRALRHPFVTDEDPCAFTGTTLSSFSRQFPEITDISYGVTSPLTPTVPSTVVTPPSILVPRKFAIYRK